MLSQTAEYALRAVLYLAGRYGEGPVRVDDAAEALKVPRNYLSKTLHVLAREGILISTRGPHGGFELAVPADELVLADVVEQFDDLSGPKTCLLGRPACSERSPCSAHQRWKHVGDTARTFYRTTTLADLFEDPAEEVTQR